MSFHAFKLLGTVFHLLNMLPEALLIFEFMRDMANEFSNSGHLIIAFECMAKVLNDK